MGLWGRIVCNVCKYFNYYIIFFFLALKAVYFFYPIKIERTIMSSFIINKFYVRNVHLWFRKHVIQIFSRKILKYEHV